MKKYTIKYQYGTYLGTEIVFAENSEEAINKMWNNLRRRGYLTLPMAYQSAKIIDSNEE